MEFKLKTRHLIPLLLMLILPSLGCVGPSILSRYVDEQYNQAYVNSPIVTEIAAPVILAASLVSNTMDVTLVNPFYWWKDALDGTGKPYYYQNPKLPIRKMDDSDSGPVE